MNLFYCYHEEGDREQIARSRDAEDAAVQYAEWHDRHSGYPPQDEQRVFVRDRHGKVVTVRVTSEVTRRYQARQVAAEKSR